MATIGYSLSKRLFDLVLALAMLVLLSPLFAAVALAIKLTSRGPVLYRGVRVGMGEKDFSMCKFRTMVAEAESIGGSSTPDDDPRITKVGSFLRRHKLDEVPQLINIVKGEMSFVGPRPQVRWAVDLYDREERCLLTVPPGITDPGSLRFPNEGEILKGSSDPDRDYMEKIHPEKMRLSLGYVRSRTLMQDILLIIRTVVAVAKR